MLDAVETAVLIERLYFSGFGFRKALAIGTPYYVPKPCMVCGCEVVKDGECVGCDCHQEEEI